MTNQDAYLLGFATARELSALVAENYYTGIIHCKHTDRKEHVQTHVEYQWCQELAGLVRKLLPPFTADELKVKLDDNPGTDAD